MYTAPKGTKISADLIKKAIAYNEKNRPEYVRMRDYYKGDHKILKRQRAENLKNNKLVINHAKYITRINVGYLLGHPVEYQAKKFDIEPVLDAYKKQTIRKVDKALGKDCSKYGRAFEYIYVDEENNIKSRLISPFNCVIVYDDTMDHKKLFAIIYESVDEDKGEKTYHGVITVDDFEMRTYTEKLEPKGSRDHSLGYVPVIEYVNNEDEVGDYYDVVSLIDAYNLLQSDRVNDKEQLVDAILMIYGFTLEADQLELLKEHRVMSAPSKNEGAEAEYLVKNLDEEKADILRKRIEDDIHKISMTPNVSDENFIGNSSGVALKYKLLPFEISVSDKEASFESGLKERFTIYNSYLNKLDKQVKLVPSYEVSVIFKKHLPQNDYEMSQTLLNLADLLDKETALSQISFVQDASEVLEKKQKEQEDTYNEESNYGDTTPNGTNPVDNTGNNSATI